MPCAKHDDLHGGGRTIQRAQRIFPVLRSLIVMVILGSFIGSALAGCTRSGDADSTQATAAVGEEAAATDVSQDAATELSADWIQGGWGPGYVMTHATYGNPSVVYGGTSSYGDSSYVFEHDEQGRIVQAIHTSDDVDEKITYVWKGETTATRSSSQSSELTELPIIEYEVDASERVVSYSLSFTVGSSGGDSMYIRETSVNRNNNGRVSDLSSAMRVFDSDHNEIPDEAGHFDDELVFDDSGYPVFEGKTWTSDDSKPVDGDDCVLTYAYEGQQPVRLTVERRAWNGQHMSAPYTYNYDLTCDEAGNITEIRDDTGNLVASFEYKRIERMSPVAKEDQLEARSHIWDAVVSSDEVPRTLAAMSERDAQ